MTEKQINSMARNLLALSMEDAGAVVKAMSEQLLVRTPSRMPPANTLSPVPGVYLIYDPNKKNLLYVGETGNLQRRRGDLDRTMNHTFRRHFGNGKFSAKAGIQSVKSSKSKFPTHLEEELTKAIGKLYAAFSPLGIGRSEIEEYLVEREKAKGPASKLFNIREKRK